MEKKINHIYFTCGLPYSGKTTFTNKLVELRPEFCIVSADSIRCSLYGQRYFATGEPFVWATRGIMLRELMKQGKLIIVDETNTTIKRRKSIITLAKEHEYNISCVHVATDFKKCKMRALEKHDEEILPTIHRMNEQFEIPKVSEGFALYNLIGEKKDINLIAEIISKLNKI